LGLQRQKKYFLLYDKLVQEHKQNSSELTWNLETHQSYSYPMLLGVQPQTCFGTGLKIFVYDTDFAVRPIACSQGMFASEVFVHKYLQHSSCATEIPEEADFFFVPVYAACVMTKEDKKAAEMDAFYKELVVEKLKYFRLQEGRDHIFLWSSETFDFPSWADHIHSSVFLSVEAQPIECTDFDFFSEETASNFGSSCRHCPSCFQPWKDVVIPGFVEKWSIQKMSAVEKKPEDRTYTACYHGADSDQLAIYAHANASVRNDLQQLRELPRVSIGYRFGKITDYFARVGQCHFCFVPKGLGYWSNRLYEVMFAGCIPVILSDGISLPFDDLLDWTSFSLKWPMAEVSPWLIQHLEDLLVNRRSFVYSLHDGVKRNRCWFDYNSADTSCSPYLGILQALQKRKANFPTWHGRFWGASSSNFSEA